MIKKDLTNIFIDEICSTPPRKKFPKIKIVYSHNDEIWSIDSAHFSDYKISKNRGYRFIFVIKDIFSKCLWAIQLKNNNNQTITQELSIILTNSKRLPVKLESDRGADFYNSLSHKISKLKIYNITLDSQIKVLL